MLYNVLLCLIGLFIGGVLGGILMYVLQEMRAGRIEAPGTLSLGPININLAGMGDAEAGTGKVVGSGSTAEFLEVAGPTAGGCLSFLGAFVVLFGFLLPWFTCNLASIFRGSFSWLSMFVQLVAFFILSIFGAAGSRDLNELGAAALLILLPTIIIVSLIPLAGLVIGRNGLRLFQAIKGTPQKQKSIGKALMRAAVIGLVPMLCYLGIATVNFDLSGLGLFGADIGVQSADIGLWVTFSGFVVSIVAGLVLSISTSVAEQLVKPDAPKSPPSRIEGPLP